MEKGKMKGFISKTIIRFVMTSLLVAGGVLFIPLAKINVQAASVTVNSALELSTALQNASTDSNSPTEIVIGSDFDGAALVADSGRYAVIDLNGCTIGVNDPSTLIRGTLTITGSGIINLSNYTSIVIYTGGELKLFGGTINNLQDTFPAVRISSQGTFTMEGGEIKSYPAAVNLVGGTFNMIDGTITHIDGLNAYHAVTGIGGTFNKYNGTINGTMDLTGTSFNQISSPPSGGGTVTSQPVSSQVTSSEDNSQENTNPNSKYDYYLDELTEKFDEAIASGTPQTIYWSEGTALPSTVMKLLKENPQITLIFNYYYEGVYYSVTLSGKYIEIDPEIPWYGPLYLYGKYTKYSKASTNGFPRN